MTMAWAELRKEAFYSQILSLEENGVIFNVNAKTLPDSDFLLQLF
jgi:hypothetical protein